MEDFPSLLSWAPNSAAGARVEKIAIAVPIRCNDLFIPVSYLK
jgi:hypothetical protein